MVKEIPRTPQNFEKLEPSPSSNFLDGLPINKAHKALSDLGATSANDPKYKAAAADFDKAVNDAGQKWAGTDEGKAEVKKVHDAEKDLDKAKDAWKPFEKYEEKKSASNP